MIDFVADIPDTTKDEQIRAWAVEKAILSGPSDATGIVYRADLIEKFVKKGKQADA